MRLVAPTRIQTLVNGKSELLYRWFRPLNHHGWILYFSLFLFESFLVLRQTKNQFQCKLCYGQSILLLCLKFWINYIFWSWNHTLSKSTFWMNKTVKKTVSKLQVWNRFQPVSKTMQCGLFWLISKGRISGLMDGCTELNAEVFRS